MSRNVLSVLLCAALVAPMLSGCAGYKLGSMLPGDIKSVHVPTFVNQSKEPLLENETTSATIREFQKDGSLKVADAESADAILTVTLVEFTLSPLAYRRDVRSAAQEYRMTIFASATLTRRSDGSIIAQHPRIKGEATFDLVGDLSSAKLRALPTAAEDLAHNIVEKMVEAWL